MSKYRIKIECLDDENENKELQEKTKDGLEVSGFAIIGVRSDDDNVTMLHHLSIMDLAKSILTCSDLMQAAFIAKGLDDARAFRSRTTNVLAKLFEDD